MFVVCLLLLRVQVYVCCLFVVVESSSVCLLLLLLRVQLYVCCLFVVVVVESSSVCLLFGFCC